MDVGQLRTLVQTSFGLTILPLAPLHEDIASGRLKAVPLVGDLLSRGVWAGHPLSGKA